MHILLINLHRMRKREIQWQDRPRLYDKLHRMRVTWTNNWKVTSSITGTIQDKMKS